MGALAPSATRIVLVRHGEAVCNVSGVCGGPVGCTGLTDRGRAQVAVLADAAVRDRRAGRGRRPLRQRPAPGRRDGDPAGPGPAGDRTTTAPMEPVQECGFCELHPGEADGLDWADFSARFGNPDWDTDPGRVIAPGGESWTGFVNRVSDTLDAVAARHPGELVVVACHAGVIESSLLAKLPDGGRARRGADEAADPARLPHQWEVDAGEWKLIGYNDGAHHLGTEGVGGGTEPTTESGRSWMSVGTGAGARAGSVTRWAASRPEAWRSAGRWAVGGMGLRAEVSRFSRRSPGRTGSVDGPDAVLGEDDPAGRQGVGGRGRAGVSGRAVLVRSPVYQASHSGTRACSCRRSRPSPGWRRCPRC